MDEPCRFAFAFVCQAGPLENKALLLAASLVRNLRCAHELIAAVPTPALLWGTPDASTMSLLESLGARVVSISNEIDATYAIGNKLSCLRLATTADRLVFLDSDMVLVRPFAGGPRFAMPFAAKPADLPNVDDKSWKRAYAAVGLRVPAGRVSTTMYGQIVPPYFNAGFIAIDPRTGFGDAWVECCKRIDGKWGVRAKRPHVDQIALPVAVAKLGLAYDCLDERYNFPAHLKPLDNAQPPIFAHYHDPAVLRREPAMRQLVRDVCAAHPALGDRLRADPQYAPLLERPARASSAAGDATSFAPVIATAEAGGSDEALAIRTAGSPASAGGHSSEKNASLASGADATPELIITGIPRSGTSYLANLLHRFGNCVVLNEPDEVSRPLRKEPIPYGVGTFLRDVRRDVLEGRPIRNKLRDGKVTDETMNANEQSQYLPAVTDDAFVLGAKNPLGFVSRLGALRRAMPRAQIAACVRNPFDTIASWKTTFSHLQTADVKEQTHGGLRDPFLSARHRAALEEVAAIARPAWRRAAWWRYLAELILDAGPGVIIVRYVEAVTDPRGVVSRVLGSFDPGPLLEPMEPSVVRAAKRSALDDEDRQAIRALCGEAAAALGVDDGWAAEPMAIPSHAGPGSAGVEPPGRLALAPRT